MGQIRTSWTQMRSTAAEAGQASQTLQVQFASAMSLWLCLGYLLRHTYKASLTDSTVKKSAVSCLLMMPCTLICISSIVNSVWAHTKLLTCMSCRLQGEWRDTLSPRLT